MSEFFAFLVGLLVPLMVWLLMRSIEDEEYELRHKAAAERLRKELP